MNELSEAARALIDTARSEENPASATELAAVHRRILAASAAAGALGVGAQAAATGAQAAALGAPAAAIGALGSGTKVAVVVHGAIGVLLGALAVSGAVAVQRTAGRPEPSERRVVAMTSGAHVEQPGRELLKPAPSASTSRIAPDDARDSAGRAQPRAAITRPPEAGSEAPSSDGVAKFIDDPGPVAAGSSRVTDELRLLERVQAELREGQGRRALQLLDEAPSGAHSQLLDERLAAEVVAACQAGDAARARRAADRLLELRPNTPLAARVRSSCIARPVSPERRDSSHPIWR